MYEYGTLKSVEAISRKAKRENKEEDEPNRGTLYEYMEMSQQRPLYSYRILIKC
jgi:hypothetical protein